MSSSPSKASPGATKLTTKEQSPINAKNDAKTKDATKSDATTKDASQNDEAASRADLTYQETRKTWGARKRADRKK